MLDGTLEGERRETIDELSDLLVVVQEMGRRLADESHGDAYAKVQELNQILHQARIHLSAIQNEVSKGG